MDEWLDTLLQPLLLTAEAREWFRLARQDEAVPWHRMADEISADIRAVLSMAFHQVIRPRRGWLLESFTQELGARPTEDSRRRALRDLRFRAAARVYIPHYWADAAAQVIMDWPTAVPPSLDALQPRRQFARFVRAFGELLWSDKHHRIVREAILDEPGVDKWAGLPLQGGIARLSHMRIPSVASDRSRTD
jgi:hypothetical protein